jgi:hypothetical protein
MIRKLDSTGAIAWEKTFGGSGGDFAQDVLRIPGRRVYGYACSVPLTSDSGYIVSGYTEINDTDILDKHKKDR